MLSTNCTNTRLRMVGTLKPFPDGHIPHPEQSHRPRNRKASQHPKRRSINIQHLITLKGCSRDEHDIITNSGMKGNKGPCRTGKPIPQYTKQRQATAFEPCQAPQSPAHLPSHIKRPNPVPPQLPRIPHRHQKTHQTISLPLFRSPAQPHVDNDAYLRPLHTPALCQTCWRFGKVGSCTPVRPTTGQSERIEMKHEGEGTGRSQRLLQ